MTFIKDKNGQWAHPGKNTVIPDADGRITMDGVNYPVLGIDDQGNKKIMMPGGEYQFPGNDVYEIPLPEFQKKGELPKLLLSKDYKNLFTQPLPSYFDDLTKGFSIQNKNYINRPFKDYQPWRKLDFDQWRNMINETNRLGNYGVSNDNPLTLQYFTNKSLLGNVNKQGEITEKNLQNITNSIQSPFIREIFGQTLTEFSGARGDGKINFDLFKQAVNEKLTPFKHVKATDNKHANVGLDRLGVKNNILRNNTILFQSDKLGPNIVKGPGGFLSKGHFTEDNVYGHLRYYVLKDNPNLIYVLENQSDELQSLHRLPQYLKSLNIEKDYYTKLLNKQEEEVALDHFNTMWSQASSPSGNLKRIGVEGGITRNSEFPLVTNIPVGSNEIKPGIKYWKNAKGYGDHFTYKQWEIEDSKFPYAIDGSPKGMVFNNYDEVLKYKQDFINNELAYLQWQEFGDNPAEWQRVYGDTYEAELKVINQKIDDISSHLVTDAGGNISAEQILRNLQKKQLQKNQSKRLFDETIIYAVDNGYKEIAFPLQSTVAKVQGYTLNEPHDILDQPWTQETVQDFYKYMRNLTSPNKNKEIEITSPLYGEEARMYGDFLYIPDNWGGTNKVNHTRYELTNPILGGMDLQTSGFHNRLIEKDLPKDLASGLYKIEADGSYTLIPKEFNGTWHDAFSNLTINFSNQARSSDLVTTGEFKMVDGKLVPVQTNTVLPEDLQSIHSIISPIRDSKHKVINDGSFNLSNFPKNQQRVLNNYTLDQYLKFAKQSFGENFEYRVGTDNNGNEFFYVKPSDQWLGDKKPIKIKKHGGEILPKYQEKGEVKEEEVTVNFDDVEKGVRHIESLDGVLMKNPESSASGLYGQLFDEIDYDGTRDEFIADIEYQKELFKKRYNGEIEGVPGLEINGIELYNEYKGQIKNFSLTPTEIAALSNMLGRQGTRNYLGNVLRDGKTLEEGVPSAYGPGKPANKTPEEFLQLFNDSIATKKLGGEMRNEVISEMLEKGAFLPKFKMGAEMSLEGVIGNYVIKKNYDQHHRLPYIQFNTSDGKIRDNRVYYDKDDKDGTDNFMIIDIDEQLKHQDREHERLKSIIKKYDNKEELSFTEEKYLKEQGLIDEVQTKKQPNISLQIEPTYSGKDIALMDINTSKDIYNKTNANNDGISLAKQIEIYDAHLNNTYGECCYNKSLKVKNIYDKLNTVYYNHAKANKMTVFDYIKSLNN